MGSVWLTGEGGTNIPRIQLGRKAYCARSLAHRLHTPPIIETQTQFEDWKTVRLEGKTALITGAGSGIGAACAQIFSDEGAQVVGADLTEGALEPVAKTIAQRSIFDVTDKASVDKAVGEIANTLGHIDLLVNSAGITRRHLPQDMPWDEAWQRVMDVNVRGTLLVSSAVMDIQRRGGRGGSIVTLSSIYGQVARPPVLTGQPDPYPHSKGAVLQVTRDLAVAGAKHNIRVNALCPGFINTAMTEGLRSDPSIKETLVSLHPLGRLGEADEVAKCALFLCSDDASFVTGTSLAVDGGYLCV